MAVCVTLMLTETAELEWKICNLELSGAQGRLLELSSLSLFVCERNAVHQGFPRTLRVLFQKFPSSLIRDVGALKAWICAKEQLSVVQMCLDR